MTTRIIDEELDEERDQSLTKKWSIERREKRRKRARLVLWSAVALVVLMCAFPPILVHRERYYSDELLLHPEPAGWAFFLDHRVTEGIIRPILVDGGRLMCQLGIVIALAVGTLQTYRWSDQERGDGAAAGDE